MRLWRSITLLLFLASISCQKAAQEAQPNTLHLVIGAAQIRDPKERDTALAEACQESANQGSAPAVLMGIPQIHDLALRDSVAAACATTLSDNGKNDDAIDAAKLISNQAKREEVLTTLGE